MAGIKHFLLAFDYAQDKQIIHREFGSDITRATAAYTELEREYKDRPLVDIVLVGSDAIESVMVTHSNYFDGVARKRVEALLSPHC